MPPLATSAPQPVRCCKARPSQRLTSFSLQKILTVVDSDVLGVNTQHFVKDEGHRSTIGIMLTDCVVDNLLQGAPAAMSARIQKGDVVLEVTVYAVCL